MTKLNKAITILTSLLIISLGCNLYVARELNLQNAKAIVTSQELVSTSNQLTDMHQAYSLSSIALESALSGNVETANEFKELASNVFITRDKIRDTFGS